MSKSTFIKSTFILSIATLLSKVLGSVFRIPLQNIAGDEVLGIFSLVYPVYMVALILSVAGIPIAISKLIAEARAEKKEENIKDIYVSASILALMFGIISFLLIWMFSHQIADVLGGSATRISLIVVSTTLLIAPYMAVYRGFFQGFEDMKPTAFSQVIEQFIRVAFILAAAYYLVSKGFSDESVAGGVMVGSSIGALVSLIYLRIRFNRFKATNKLPASSYTYSTFKKWGKRILHISIPICIGAITMALLNFIDSITIPFALKAAGNDQGEINYLYGIYGRGLALVQIATVFATSIVLPLIPLITSKMAAGQVTETKSVIERTHRITHLLSWPAAFGLLALTLPLNLALFTNLEGSLVLAIIGFSSVFTSLTVLGTGILQGMNLAKQAAYIIVFGVIIKTIVNIVLIQQFELTGAAVSTLVVYIVLFLLNSMYIQKKNPFQSVTKQTFIVIGASLIMGAIIGLPTLFLSISNWTRLQALLYAGGAAVIGAMIFFALIVLLKGISKQELTTLPVIGKFIR
ncbi:polysaccharide biosynthesis protein [Rossellomorea aquimaris]|uniref:putative polysaccharide biosynthesis protein n=1 Tax=Rossellomorea aquimaris TaxID=189382 RepID=UPI001CFD67AC|nr:polysaccharide biosynthesis protein [Rossellomorea aquimaris]